MWGVNLRWRSDTRLAVEYLEASRARLNVQKASVAGQTIEVELLPGVSDPTAPAGSMLDSAH